MNRDYCIFNGKLIESADLPASEWVNRAFLYGDSLFETIRGYAASPINFSLHWKRLTEGMRLLKLTHDDSFSESRIQGEIERLLNKSRLYKSSRIRLTVFRNSGGLYTPEDNRCTWLLQSSELKDEKFVLNQKGMIVDIFDEVHKPLNALSSVKSGNALIYVLAGIYKQHENLDDCILLNQYGRISEFISSNLFLLHENRIITPPLSEGCLNGVMRKTVLELLPAIGYACVEKPVTEVMLLEADELFMTNAIQGVQWVGAYKDRRYYNFAARKLIGQLNLKLIEV